MIILVGSCLIRISILWPDKADIFYEKAMIIQNIPLSLHQYVETELNKKKVIYLSKGNASHSIRMYCGFLCFLWHKFCKQMCVKQMSPFIQIQANEGIIYCAFLIEYV